MKTLASIILFASLLLTAHTLQASNTSKMYSYIDSDGTHWLTDMKHSHSNTTKYKPFNTPTSNKTSSSLSCPKTSSSLFKQRKTWIDPIIANYAKKNNISRYLIEAIVTVESCYDHKATSYAGAKGLMQLMPRTAKWLGVKNSFNADENLRAGIKYFGTLYKQFNYNQDLALAAYNAGPSNVRKYGGIPPFPETQKYVLKVLKQYKVLLKNN